MAKKSIFQKMGLVQSNEEEYVPLDTSYLDHVDTEELPEVDLGDADFLTIDSVYEQSGLQDFEQSIFKADEFGKVLPNSLATEVRRQSVIGILSASNLSVDTLVEDADKRVLSLKSVQQLTTKNTTDFIVTNEERIAELLLEVDSLKQLNNDRRASQEKQDIILNEEIVRVNEIKKFIAPDSL